MKKAIQMTVLITMMMMIGTLLHAQQYTINFTTSIPSCSCGFKVAAKVEVYFRTPTGLQLVDLFHTMGGTSQFRYMKATADLYTADAVVIIVSLTTHKPQEIIVKRDWSGTVLNPIIFTPFRDNPPPASHRCQ